MRVQLKQPWGQWSKGHVFADMPGGQARTLIARGIAEPLADLADKALRAPADRMIRRREIVTRQGSGQ